MKYSKEKTIDDILFVQKRHFEDISIDCQNMSEQITQAKANTKSQMKTLQRLCDEMDFSIKNNGMQNEDCLFDTVPNELKLTEKEENEAASCGHVLVNSERFIRADGNWEDYVKDAYTYFHEKNLHSGNCSLVDSLPPEQRHQLAKQIEEDFTFKKAHCDKYDYTVAAACGLIGGLIDILFVGAPGTGALTKFSDEKVNQAVMQFARFCGWTGPREGSAPLKSAIGFLESKFKVNYDHPYGAAVGGRFKMSTKNHHVKSLAHSPDLVGLFFSILDQFTNSAHFVSDGKLLRVDTDKFELSGTDLVSKLFAGFANWLGHLVSDMAGSSGAIGRGSGIPLPFYSLLQFINIGEFGQFRQTFASISVQVFEQGYDLRHALALSIPVLTSELLTRLCWTVKQVISGKKPWKACLPSSNVPELNRMLLVAYGSFCVIDAGSAAIRSGGQIVSFLLNSNIISWCRFGMLSWRELKHICNDGVINHEDIDKYIDIEYSKILKNS